MELRGCLLLCLCVVAVKGVAEDLDETDSLTQDSSHHYVELKEPTVFDSYFGKPLKPKRQRFLENVGNGTAQCTVLVNPCKKDEGRRVDGTCINPHYPSRGARFTPFLLLLPPIFGPGNALRAAKDGSELPSTRVIRTTLLGDGYFADKHWSMLSTHFFVFSFVDVADLFHLLRYVVVSDCCINNQTPNRANPLCIPIPVPADDPYLRRTGIRCMNLTREETFQDYGCISNMLPAARYSRITPHLDLSTVYGNSAERGMEIRAREGGLLAFRMEGDREVPAGQSPFCLRNMPPREVACYNFGDPYHGNALPGTLLTSMWFFREHNRLARELAKMNPCWDDDKLYNTARQINIAQWQYFYYYEIVGEILGHKNALAEGLITDRYGHVNDFDPKYPPGTYREYVIGARYFHTFQPALNDLYRDHEYKGSRTAVDDGFRSGIYPLNGTEADLTEGAIIQPADDFDLTIDPDLAERLHGENQAASDLPAIDMMRGRDAGLPSYNHYRKLCGMKVAKHFEDFEDTIDKDKVEQLSRLYDDVDDVELMVAIYVEKLLPNAFVGPTLYCITVQNLLHWRRSDKYFFEHGNYHNALTADQLHAIKQTSTARILCDNGDGIKAIQPKAMFRKSEWNDYVSCKQIPGIDLSYWKEHKKCLPPLKPKAPEPTVAAPMSPMPMMPSMPMPPMPMPPMPMPPMPMPPMPMMPSAPMPPAPTPSMPTPPEPKAPEPPNKAPNSPEPAAPQQPKAPEQPSNPQPPKAPEQPSNPQPPKAPEQPSNPQPPKAPEQPSNPQPPKAPEQPSSPQPPKAPEQPAVS